MLCISFIFMPAYRLGSVAGAAALGAAWTTSRPTAISETFFGSTLRQEKTRLEMLSLHLDQACSQKFR